LPAHAFPDGALQSHECSSCGFWPGDENSQPTFYAYAYPEPPGYSAYGVAPPGAHYDTTVREFLLPYETLCAATNPDEMLLGFFQSTYGAAADLGRWDRTALDRVVPNTALEAPPAH
jgi:hypothetical protein